MKRNILISLIIIVIIMVVVSLSISKFEKPEDSNMELIKVNEVTRSVFYAPQYVAIKNEYFKNNGIEIDLVTGQGADAVMTSVLTGDSDIGFAGPEAAIYVYNEGKEDYPQIFAQMTQKDGSFLISREPNENFQWEDLKGSTIIPGRKGGVPYMTLEYVLKNNGIDPQVDVVLDDSIKFDLMAGAFASGNADYVTLFEPTASMTEIEKQGYIVASVGAEAGEIPYTAYFATQSYIRENEEIIQNFTNAIYEGQKWVENHTAKEIADTIKEFFPSTDVELLEEAIQQYKNIDAWSDTPVLEEEAFERLQTIMMEADELSQFVPYSEIVNNKYSQEAIEK